MTDHKSTGMYCRPNSNYIPTTCRSRYRHRITDQTLTISRPNTEYIPTKYRPRFQPHNDHVTDQMSIILPSTLTIYRTYTDQMATINRRHTDHVTDNVSTKIPTTLPTKHIPIKCRPHPDHIPTISTTCRPQYCSNQFSKYSVHYYFISRPGLKHKDTNSTVGFFSSFERDNTTAFGPTAWLRQNVGPDNVA